MADTKTVKFQVYLPEDLRTRFKAKCVVSGTTMNETAVKLIEAWTDKDELVVEDETQPLPSLKELIEQLGVQMMKENVNPMRVRELAMGAAKPNKKEQELLLRLSGLKSLPD